VSELLERHAGAAVVGRGEGGVNNDDVLVGSGFDALIAKSMRAVDVLSLIAPTPPGRSSKKMAAWRNMGTRAPRIYQPNGAREIARRTRQVAAGQLTRANGLV
jgi:hypothetical protein